MTHTEQTTLKEFKNSAIKWIVGLAGACIIGLTSFYFTTKAEVEYQRQEISELKSVVKEASPQEIGRIKHDLNELKEKVENLAVQASTNARVMESFKSDMERKSDKMLELLIELKRQGN